VVSGGLDKMVHFWPVDKPHPEPPQRPQPQQKPAPAPPNPTPALAMGGDVLAIAFSRHGKTLAAAVSDSQAKRPVPGTVAIVDVPNRRIRAQLRGHLGAVHALAFILDDAETLATGGADRWFRFWDAQSGTAVGGACIGPRPP